MKWIIALFLPVLCLQAVAQRGRQLEPIFVQGTAYRNTGWFISPGITYMLPQPGRQSITQYNEGGDASDTLFSGDYRRRGRIGLYLEGGRHHFLDKSYLVHHIDYGIHFKMLRGRENFSGITNTGAGMVPVENKARFSESFAGVFFNASNIIQVKNNLWIQNSLGVNGDFRVLSNRSIDGPPYGAEMMFPDRILAQLHYKIGFGWKPEPGIYIIPMIETPLISAYPWDDGRSTLQYFAGRYRPIIFTIRVQWLSQAANRRCDTPGKGPDLDKDNPGGHKQNGLWGPEHKKMRRARKK